VKVLPVWGGPFFVGGSNPKTKIARKNRGFYELLKVPARAIEHLIDLLGSNAISEIGEADSEALVNFLSSFIRGIHDSK